MGTDFSFSRLTDSATTVRGDLYERKPNPSLILCKLQKATVPNNVLLVLTRIVQLSHRVAKVRICVVWVVQPCAVDK